MSVAALPRAMQRGLLGMSSPCSKPVVDVLGRGALLRVIVAALQDEACHI